MVRTLGDIHRRCGALRGRRLASLHRLQPGSGSGKHRFTTHKTFITSLFIIYIIIYKSDLISIIFPFQCLNAAGKVTVWDLISMTKIGELRGGSPYQQFGYALAVGNVKAAGIDREVNNFLTANKNLTFLIHEKQD